MMKITNQFLLVFLCLWSVVLCGQSDYGENKPKKKGLQRNLVIDVSGTNRNYHLFVPKDPINAPLVLLLHGNRSSHNKTIGLSRGKAPYKIWLDIAKRENIIIAVPNGTRGSNKHRGWNDCRSDAKTNPQLDDVLFMSTLIDFIADTYKANTAKVYAVGTSNGGHMAMRLAQEMPNKLTAFAAIAASNPVNTNCANSTVPISALIINGTDDPILPFEGGQMVDARGQVYSAQETINYWVSRNKADTTAVVTKFPDIDPSDKCTVKKHIYRNGTDNTEVAFFEVVDGGHTEPSMVQRYRRAFKWLVGEQNGDIEMASEVWNFFKTK